MAVIFDRINRIIKVEAPTTKMSIQELLDTIRDWEDDQCNMDVSKIADAAGKEILDENTKVGITLKLLNWKIKFEERAFPTVCDIYGGNLVAINGYGEPMNPIEPSSNVTVTKTSSSSATLVEGESGLSTEEHTKLMGIPWLNEIESSPILAKQEQVLRSLGLNQENYALDQMEYVEFGALKLMKNTRLRIYTDSQSVGSDENVLATYKLMSDYDKKGRMTSYRVIKI